MQRLRIYLEGRLLLYVEYFPDEKLVIEELNQLLKIVREELGA